MNDNILQIILEGQILRIRTRRRRWIDNKLEELEESVNIRDLKSAKSRSEIAMRIGNLLTGDST